MASRAAQAFLAGVLCTAQLQAATYRFQLDPEATSVTFRLKATAHVVHGRLSLRSGWIEFDPAATTTSGEIQIDAHRAETGNKKRDRNMHSRVLLSDAHPLIRFVPSRLEGAVDPIDGSEFLFHGTVLLVGEEHPLTLPVNLKIDGGQPIATTTFIVPYVEWGLHHPSTLLLKVAKEVTVTVEAHGELSQLEIE